MGETFVLREPLLSPASEVPGGLDPIRYGRAPRKTRNAHLQRGPHSGQESDSAVAALKLPNGMTATADQIGEGGLSEPGHCSGCSYG